MSVASAPTPRLAAALVWTGTLGMATVAVMRCLVFFAPQLVFDWDPSVDPDPLGGLGPAGSLWLDVALLVACAAALLGEALAGRRLEWWLLLLAAAPVPVVVWHGVSDAGDLWRGSTWAAGALAAVSAFHVSRSRAPRTVLIMLLAGVVGPLLVRGAANVTYEYDGNIELWELEVAEDRLPQGWEVDSPSALIFERRLRQRNPTGWFLTSNIYAAFMIVGCVVGTGLAAASARARLPGGWAGAAVLAAAASAAGLWMSGSKGAVVAAAVGLALLVLPGVPGRVGSLARRLGPLVAVGCVGLALTGVAVRGAVLPEGFMGDRSLLYRWHYTISSAHILAEHPLVGVGPDGYQTAYVAHRLPRNPEEVASAHSVFWDWACGLGAAGSAWIVLALVLAWRTGRAWRSDGEDLLPAGPEVRAAVGLGSIVVVTVFGIVPAILVERSSITEFELVVRGLGAAAFAALSVATGHVLIHGRRGPVRYALAAAAVALLVQGQIEMTFAQPGAVVWIMTVLGVAAASGSSLAPPPNQGRAFAVIVVVVVVALAGGLAVLGATPATRQGRLMLDAARELRPLAGIERPPDRANEAALRRRAARTLLEAYEAMPTNLVPRAEAADQLARAARVTTGAEREALLRDALEHALACFDRGGPGPAAVLAVDIHEMLAVLTGDPAHRATAIKFQQRLVDADPNGLVVHRRLGDLLWEYGRPDAARAAYRRALEIDEAFSLDPLKRLPERHRAVIERRAADP